MITVTALVGALGTGMTGCVTTVSGHGVLDPAATDQPVAGATSVPAESASPTPRTATPTLDAATDRRLTCALVLPIVGDTVQKWNDYVDHKRGTRESVTLVLQLNAATIEGLFEGLPAGDPVRVTAAKLTAEMLAMAAALRAGKNPSPVRFNTLKGELLRVCPT
ncbi:MAG: hypothetical protein HYR62_03955 [Actinobacteria bacterium]|nr:hypothetical protein [Actinomycetota bacterium]